MEGAGRGDTLNRRDRTVRHRAELCDARPRRRAVYEHCARAADPFAAGRLGACERQLLAKDKQQRSRHIAGDVVCGSVHRQAHLRDHC
jgi:hypothetical protein